MNTDTTTTEAKYTLLYYRPNGSRYEGCGDYTRFDSELECFVGVTREEMLKAIVEKTKHASSCCGSCPASETETEFAILKDGRPLLSRGNNLSSFYDDEMYESEEYFAVSDIFDEAAAVIEQEHKAEAEAEKKAKEEAAKVAAEAAKRQAEAAALAKELSERRMLEELKAKYGP